MSDDLDQPDTFVVERMQGDLVVQRIVSQGTQEDILDKWSVLYPNDSLVIFPCDIDDEFELIEIEDE